MAKVMHVFVWRALHETDGKLRQEHSQAQTRRVSFGIAA